MTGWFPRIPLNLLPHFRRLNKDQLPPSSESKVRPGTGPEHPPQSGSKPSSINTPSLREPLDSRSNFRKPIPCSRGSGTFSRRRTGRAATSMESLRPHTHKTTSWLYSRTPLPSQRRPASEIPALPASTNADSSHWSLIHPSRQTSTKDYDVSGQQARTAHFLNPSPPRREHHQTNRSSLQPGVVAFHNEISSTLHHAFSGKAHP